MDKAYHNIAYLLKPEAAPLNSSVPRVNIEGLPDQVVNQTMVGLSKQKLKTFVGSAHFRHRLVLSTLSSTPVRITKIRENDSQTPGLSPSEISFIRLLDKVTSGAVIQINETGTTLTFKPGLLIGGDRIAHECHPSRSVAYYLEPLLMLAPFCKLALNVTLRGPTHGESDVCADSVAGVSVPLLRRLTAGASIAPRVDVKRRAAQSDQKANGGGRGGIVTFRCEVTTSKLRAIDLIEAGVVKRVRGIAFGNRVSPGHISRMIDISRGILNRFSPDVYIHADHCNNIDCGVGFGLHLMCETTDGCLIGGDWSCHRSDVAPEIVAQSACSMLLEEIENGGCIDSNNVCLALLYAALADSDLSRIRVGRLSQAAIAFLRDIHSFLGVQFNTRVLGGALGDQGDQEHSDDKDDGDDEDDEDDEVEDQEQDGTGEKNGGGNKGYGIIMSCVGVGLSNIARQRF